METFARKHLRWAVIAVFAITLILIVGLPIAYGIYQLIINR